VYAAGPNFDTVGALNGSYMIPPDSASAAGVSGVLVAVNGVVQEFHRTGVGPSSQLTAQAAFKLDALFASASGFSGGAFDPRVLYDSIHDKFVVVAVDQNSTAKSTHILVAVSNNGDPHSAADFQAQSIDVHGAIPGSWADFPQAALDSSGNIYVTANMFSFSSGQFTGSRLWIIPEANVPTASPQAIDPSFNAGVGNGASDLFSLAPTNTAGFTDPATHVNTGGSSGTYLVSYNSATNSAGHDVVNIIHASGGIYTAASIDVGKIDQSAQFGGISAPQPGASNTLDADDSRTALGVFHAGPAGQPGHLYVAATIVPTTGPDAGHATAHWWAFETDPTSGNVTKLVNQGDISGNTFAPGSNLRTYYPSLAVTTVLGSDGQMHDQLAVSFSSSAPATGSGYDGYASAYEVKFDPLASIGYNSATHYEEIGATATGTHWNLLASGLASYYRTFGGHDNRWGDYSSITVDPTDNSSVWAFNQYAMTPGTSILGQTGRWGTELGLFV
jgi:hypothetical protein